MMLVQVGQKPQPNLESAGGRLRVGRCVLGTPTPEARQGHIKSAGAVLKSAAGFDEGSLKVQPAATEAA